MTFYCDEARHMVCYPYSVINLHAMAKALGVHRCWFHNSPGHAHYDMPMRRIAELTAKCNVVSTRVILRIMKGEDPTSMKTTQTPPPDQANH